MTFKKPNILWLSHNVPYPPKTGVLQRNYNLIKEASKIGNIYLIAVFQKNILPINFDLVEIKRELGKFCTEIEIIYLPIDSSKLIWFYTAIKSLFTRDPFASNWLKSSQIKQSIEKLLGKVNFNIVHYDTISFAHYYCLTKHITCILNHHNVESHLMERRAKIEKNPFKRFYFKQESKKLKHYEKYYCDKFQLNFTVSESDKNLLQKVNPKIKCEIIPNGVDIAYFTRKKEQRVRGQLLFAGGMNWYPNRDAVLCLVKDIWPKIRKKYPETTMTIVGANPPQEIIELSNTDRRLKVTGFVDDVRPYFIRADMYLCPMRDGGGTRLKVLDTLSMETVLISTTMGCEGVNITPNENVLIADTPREFSNQVGRVLNDSHFRSILVNNGRKLIEQQYSWSVIGERLKNTYQSISEI